MGSREVWLYATVAVVLVSAMAMAEAEGKVVVVGGGERWRFGFNYSAWAAEQPPFRVGDTLVFKYEPAVVDGRPVNHNVYLLHSSHQYRACSFGKAQLLANTTQGREPGFHYTLALKRKNYFFACSIAQGLHCNQGLMKFWVRPL